MSKVVSSIGVEFYVGYTKDRNSRPTWEQYQKLPQIVECSELDFKPDAMSIKSYDDLGQTHYVPDSVDTGGVHSLTAILTKNRECEILWNKMCRLYNEGYYIWLYVLIPTIDEATYIPICPINTGMRNIKPQDKITTNLYYTIVDKVIFADSIKPIWGKTWNYISTFNGGQQLTSSSEMDIDDINKLFNNLFYLKGD